MKTMGKKKMIDLVIISGTSGSGKSYLLANHNYLGVEYSIVKKKTTRPPRRNENTDDNAEFIFNVSEEEVASCEYSYYFRKGHYGFNCDDIDKLLAQKKIPMIIIRRINEIIILKKKYKNAVAILCESNLPDDELSKLLQNYGSSFDEIQTRIFSEDEKIIKKEYSENRGVFNFVLKNNYDSSFLFSAKKFLDDIRCVK